MYIFVILAVNVSEARYAGFSISAMGFGMSTFASY